MNCTGELFFYHESLLELWNCDQRICCVILKQSWMTFVLGQVACTSGWLGCATQFK